MNINNSGFWIRVCLVGSAFLLISSIVQAQELSYEALPRAKKVVTDSARDAAAAKQSATRLKQQLAAQHDSIARLNKALKGAATVAHVDTVRVTETRVDTVRVEKPVPNAPTGYSLPATAPSSAPASQLPAPNSITFAPPTVSGLLQIMLSGGDSALRSTYRVRRAEVKVVSDLGKHAQAIVMVDVSKALALSTNGTSSSVTQSSRVLQDALLSMPLFGVQVEAGQQRLPLGYEGSTSASVLETVDRALMESDKARGASFGDVRDLGAAARGKWRWIEYRAGAFNGSGESQNDVDKNVGKAIVGQLAFKPPFVPGLRIGSSAASSGPGTLDKPTRDRVGVELTYNIRSALFQAEAMHGQDGAIMRGGVYTLASVKARPTVKLTARFDAWDPDVSAETTAANVTERDYLAGFTWLPSATRLKLQFAVVHKTYTRAITPSVTLAQTQLQASW